MLSSDLSISLTVQFYRQLHDGDVGYDHHHAVDGGLDQRAGLILVRFPTSLALEVTKLVGEEADNGQRDRLANKPISMVAQSSLSTTA